MTTVKITHDWTTIVDVETKGLTLNANPMNIDLAKEPLLKPIKAKQDNDNSKNNNNLR